MRCLDMVYISPTHPHLPSSSLTRIHANLHTCTHAHTHTCTHTHTHTYTHTHTHAHTHMHTHTGTYTGLRDHFKAGLQPSVRLVRFQLDHCLPHSWLLSPHLQRVWLVRLVNDQKDETSVVRQNWQKRWILIRVKLSSGLQEAQK